MPQFFFFFTLLDSLYSLSTPVFFLSPYFSLPDHLSFLSIQGFGGIGGGGGGALKTRPPPAEALGGDAVREMA